MMTWGMLLMMTGLGFSVVGLLLAIWAKITAGSAMTLAHAAAADRLPISLSRAAEQDDRKPWIVPAAIGLAGAAIICGLACYGYAFFWLFRS
jgi:hypothetical protein